MVGFECYFICSFVFFSRGDTVEELLVGLSLVTRRTNENPMPATDTSVVYWSFFCNHVLQDRSFTFILKTPPASVLLLKAAGRPSLASCYMLCNALLLWIMVSTPNFFPLYYTSCCILFESIYIIVYS